MDIHKFCVAGINYKKADAELRSLFAVNDDQYTAILSNASSFGLSEISHSGIPTDSVTKIDKGGVTTISARWINVKPHENLWIHYKLEPRSISNTNANQNK